MWNHVLDGNFNCKSAQAASRLYNNSDLASERKGHILKELKPRENILTAARSYCKLGRQISGHVKPNSIEKKFLTSLEVPRDAELWRCIEGKDAVEDRIIQWNVEQLSHAGQPPFGYTDLGKELVHTGDSPRTNDIYDIILKHDALSDPTIQSIEDQLKKHPLLVKIIKPTVTPEDFKSAFKCVPEKTASLLSGGGVHHYKACAKGLKDCLPDIICEVYAEMMTFSLDTGYCPKRWKHAIYVMLEKIQGVSRSDK
jgi:hypothetical protein